MKKSLIVFSLILSVAFLTGCETGSLKCKKKYDDEVKYTVKIDAVVSDKKIKNATSKLSFENSSDASRMCELKKIINNKKVEVICYEKDIVIKNYQYLESEKDDGVITKEDFVKKLKNQGFKC